MNAFGFAFKFELYSHFLNNSLYTFMCFDNFEEENVDHFESLQLIKTLRHTLS